MKDLRPIRGRYYIQRLIEEGEHEQQDFKFAIADARKIARSISAFANNSGGRLLIGVKDNGTIAGVRNDEDIYLVEQAAQMYCRPAQEIETTAYTVDAGVVVVKITIRQAQERPVRVIEDDGRQRAYFRVADENIAVPRFVERAWRHESAAATLLASDGYEHKLLALLDAEKSVTFDAVVRRLHITTDGAEKILARLFALKIIDFQHTHGGFNIILRPSTDDLG